jgi:hypothetical protein
MNWDAIGAIAELLGAIGVIASLVYLAMQIRHSREQMGQNTRALRANSYQQFRHEISEAYHGYMKVPGFSKILRLGMADYEKLDDEDAFIFTFWMVAVMSGYENAYYQYRVGLLDRDRWEIQRSHIAGLLESTGVAQWWRTREMDLGPEFVALVEEILGEERVLGNP